jgi:LmbE family N-acetylglucosaminyl deacetylase
MRHVLILALAAILAFMPPAGAAGDAPRDARGQVGLALMLRKLATTGTVMLATAHPDDEHNALISRLSHGEGLRVVIATATRGSGGQNEIGPELFDALGVLRTEELQAARRFDGAEQFFGAAVDFGYSFSIEETYEKWGREATVGDYVRLIRRTRPDVIITMRPDGAGGGQHHQASARLAAEAFEAAGDPATFTQFGEDGPPWRARRLYRIAWYGFEREVPQPAAGDRAARVETDVYDPVLGRTFAEVGSEARAMHKSQGFGQLLQLPGSRPVILIRSDPDAAHEPDDVRALPHDGLDLSLEGLGRRFAGPDAPAALNAPLAEIARHVNVARERSAGHGPDAAIDPLLAGLRTVQALRRTLTQLDVDKAAKFEIGYRLDATESKFRDALALAHGLRLEALAEDGVITPGQPVTVTVIAANRGARPIAWQPVRLRGLTGAAGCESGVIRPGAFMRCEAAVVVPPDARVTEPYWQRVNDKGRHALDGDAPFGLPFRPTPFVVEGAFESGPIAVPVALPIERRYEGNIFSGEKRMELHVVPVMSVRVAPEIAIVPAADEEPPAREVRVTVTSNAPGTAEANVRLDVPQGWTVEPASEPARFSRADEAVTVRFILRPGRQSRPGRYEIRAVAEAGGRTYDRGFQVVEYPHTPRRHLFRSARAVVQLIDVTLPAGLKVGYVMGVGDQVPPAIEQLGAEVTLLERDDLAWADLSLYDAIVTGVRAYERRPDLRAYNHRLLEYARRGGTVIVQYNKFEFNDAQYGPYPAKVSSTRVTDEGSPVTLLEPDHPVFLHPNRITDATWKGWTQERGLYFLGERDSRYVDLVELVEPFELNAGAKRGALVEASVGHGRWIYVGLGLWRQLPAGTEGAYQLLANLISLSRNTRRPGAASP